MARIVGRLNSRQCANAKPSKGKRKDRLADGGNLFLQLARSKSDPKHISRSWEFNFELDGKRGFMGLGPLHTVSLAEARDKARKLRQLLLEGVSPLDERRKQRAALTAERARTVTFKQCAQAYLDLHLDSFKNAKHRYQWRATLETYAYPKIGHMTVADVGPADVLRCIEPLWNTKRETASRVRQRIKKILDYAAERELRTGENPAASITSRPKGKNGRGQHLPALPYAELPAFMAELRVRESLSARALEFTILTAARTGETIGATRDEFDPKAKTWTIPAQRMKAGKEHRVPLCVRALEILRGLERHGDKLFPLSNMGMLELLRGMRPGVTVHGMRSTFRDWAAERTNYPREVAEMALAHTIPDAVERAYRRGDLFEKRRRLMQAWSDYCTKPASKGTIVTPLHRAVS